MAQSVRVSDEFYEMAQLAGAALGRSLAQQIEYWARLGAAMDAAGITSQQAMQMLTGDTSLRDRVMATLGAAGEPDRVAQAIAARHALIEEEVVTGQRSAESLFAFRRDAIQSATMIFAAEPTPSSSTW
nr:hypothetical protein [uncultured Roseateles sp.]